jgi:dihydroorotase
MKNMRAIIIKNGTIINRGKRTQVDLYIKDGRIVSAGDLVGVANVQEIDAAGKWILPGVIDDQVHFREPGLTHKANIGSEARAAVAGGVTSFMEMPNTKPASLTRELLEEKYQIAAKTSLANYSFYMGVSNDNAEEALRINPTEVCGLKIFMGSSTGNMLVDAPETLSSVFADSPTIIATHCEDEKTVTRNQEQWLKKYGDALSAKHHPGIRSAKACVLSSSLAISLAKKYQTRLHILHISTADEIAQFERTIPLLDKRITSEVCVHHLYFHAGQYAKLGNLIKCNPAIKSKKHRDALRKALLDGYFDVIATDHAPHTFDEKSLSYTQAPSGLPLVQHSLNIMLDFCREGWITPEQVVMKMCHAPADLFRVVDRGYLDEGYWADLVIVNPNARWTVQKENLYYKCGWSPLEGKAFTTKVEATLVNGNLVYQNGQFFEHAKGQRMVFARP